MLSKLIPGLRSFVRHEILRRATLIAIAAFLVDWVTKSWALQAWSDVTLPLGALTLGVHRNDAFSFSSGAGRVALDRITFYALEEQTTMMNLYKAGELDATYNHTVPIAWNESVRGFRDYMNAPEAANEYYQFNLTHPPMDDVRVRRAFNLAVDKEAFARFKRTARALDPFISSS